MVSIHFYYVSITFIIKLIIKAYRKWRDCCIITTSAITWVPFWFGVSSTTWQHSLIFLNCKKNYLLSSNPSQSVQLNYELPKLQGRKREGGDREETDSFYLLFALLMVLRFKHANSAKTQWSQMTPEENQNHLSETIGNSFHLLACLSEITL